MWLKENTKQQMNDAIYVNVIFKTGQKFLLQRNFYSLEVRQRMFYHTYCFILLFIFALKSSIKKIERYFAIYTWHTCIYSKLLKNLLLFSPLSLKFCVNEMLVILSAKLHWDYTIMSMDWFELTRNCRFLFQRKSRE